VTPVHCRFSKKYLKNQRRVERASKGGKKSMSAGPVLGFELEWFDSTSGMLKKMFLKFFLDDNTIEILQVSLKEKSISFASFRFFVSVKACLAISLFPRLAT